MSSTPRDFVLAPPLQLNKYDVVTQTVQEGYSYPVHDNVSGANINVFVPASVHTPDGVDTLVEAALAPIRESLSRNPG